MSYDLVVIGGGPAGYVGAIRAAQLGKKVACVEMERAGGTCLNWGCIPTKALLKSAELYHQIQRASEFGLKIEGKIGFDFAAVMQRSRGVSDQMAKGIEYLFKAKKVDYFVGKGQVAKDKKVTVTAPDGKTQVLEAKNVLLATGATPRVLPGLEPDGKVILTSREALALKERPESIIILGAGAIGVEFAWFFNTFGTKVTLVEMQSQILPVEDAESAALHSTTVLITRPADDQTLVRFASLYSPECERRMRRARNLFGFGRMTRFGSTRNRILQSTNTISRFY